MDYIGNVKRALGMVWTHKVLWLLGLLASCAGGGVSGSFNFNMPTSGVRGTPAPTVPPSKPSLPAGPSSAAIDAFLSTLRRDGGTYIGIIVAIICLLFVVGLLFWLVGVIGRGALVAGAQQIDRDGRTTFNLAWSEAMVHAKGLIIMNIVLFLPAWIAGLLSLAVSAMVFLTTILPLLTSAGDKNLTSIIAPFIGLIAVFFLVLCGLSIYGIFASIVRVFAERAIILERYGVMAGLRRGWTVLRTRMGEGLITGIINWLIGVIVSIVVGVVVFGGFIAIAVAAVGASVVSNGGIFDQIGPAIVVPLACLGLVVGLLVSVIGGALIAVSSTNWTLAYKQMAAQVPV